jgi:hypothetical protein
MNSVQSCGCIITQSYWCVCVLFVLDRQLLEYVASLVGE